MKKFKLSSKRKSSGQVVVLLIIVLALLGGAWWWLNSNKESAAKEGTAFAKEAIQKIGVQHDVNFFNSRLSPRARMNFPGSAQQEFMNEIVKLGAPVRPVDVQGKIEFNSQFFEPHGSFHARIYYPARYADMDITVSHPVGRWQIDEIAFIPQQQPGPGPVPEAAPPPPAAPAPQAPPASPGEAAPQAPPVSPGAPAPQAPPASTGAPGAGG
jgi:hypothetical protein